LKDQDMTIKPRSLVHVLALATLIAQPVAAQSTRTTPQTPRPAPAPAPRPATPAPTTPAALPATPAPASVGTTGRTSEPAAATTTVPTGIRPWNEQDYRLGPGDKLRVEVYGEPQLSQALQVRPDGKITLTLIGDIGAAGRTSLELRDALTTALKQYINSPSVTVIVQDAVANQIDVVGEVASPGQQVLLGPVTILQAVSRAGGLKEFAKRGSIYVLRHTSKGGTPQRIDAQYKDALNGKVAPMVLQPGDTVVVP
jgi:polysaccharide export outer membrane protein